MRHWEAKASRAISAGAGAVWELWEDAARWPEWNPAIAAAKLVGPFAIGTVAVIRFRGRPPMKFEITALEPGTAFVDEARLPGARLGHEHRVAEGDGDVTVTHRIYFEGPLAEVWGALMGRRIRRDLRTFLDNEQRLVA